MALSNTTRAPIDCVHSQLEDCIKIAYLDSTTGIVFLTTKYLHTATIWHATSQTINRNALNFICVFHCLMSLTLIAHVLVCETHKIPRASQIFVGSFLDSFRKAPIEPERINKPKL